MVIFINDAALVTIHLNQPGPRGRGGGRPGHAKPKYAGARLPIGRTWLLKRAELFKSTF